MTKPLAAVTAKIIKSILKVAPPTGLLQLQHHCSKNNKSLKKKKKKKRRRRRQSSRFINYNKFQSRKGDV
jgi:hypothetical protein